MSFARKPLELVLREANDPNIEGRPKLKRSLTAFHLTMLGIGGIIGAGIFSLTGTAAYEFSGPGIAYSFMIGGLLCTFAGLCYAELAAMIPVAGSAYTYAYTTLGEFVAWIIGWDLILEYTFGAVVVAIAWSGYFVELLYSLGIPIPDPVIVYCAGPFETVTLSDGTATNGIVNLPASAVAVFAASILYRGIRESAWVNNLIVVLKVGIILIFVTLGLGVVNSENLIANPAATGLSQLVPPVTAIAESDWTALDRLLNWLFGIEPSRYGWGFGGVLTGAGVVFFAYIGFDAVSTMAQETKSPQTALPIGILGSLAVCTLLYILVSITLTGVAHYTELGVPAPIALGIDRIATLRGFSDGASAAFTASVKLGALAGLTSVIIVLMLGQTRVFYAMGSDHLLPFFDRTHERYQTPHIATIVTGSFVAIAAAILPMSLVGELVSIGTLLAFLIVCIAVPVLRKRAPDAPRGFRIKAPLLVGMLGAASCLFVMLGLPPDTWLRLIVWLLLGVILYFSYGRKHSKLRQLRRIGIEAESAER